MFVFSEALLNEWISSLIWPFFRVLGVFSVAPIFSSKAFPFRVRVLLALMIAWTLSALTTDSNVTLQSPGATGFIIYELLVGLSIGFVVRLVFAAMELAGEFIGLQIGLGFAGFLDPANNTQSNAMASLFGHMTALLFVVINGHLLVLNAVMRSYERFPLGGNLTDVIQGLRVFDFASQIFASAFWLALPMTVLMLLTNLALGIISRVAPQMNLYAVGFPITIGAGLAVLSMLLPLIDRSLAALMDQAMTFLWHGVAR